MTVPRVAAIHDLSCFGRCSLTIVMPTLSAMGVQCCPLPTACLSTHTGGFQNNTFLDLTAQLEPIAAHWKAEGVTFDAVYTGFMSSQEQIALTADFIRNFNRPDCRIIIDPVMGDHGTPYRTYTPAMCRAMTELAALADIITPNRTEAALLLSENYENIRLDTESDCRRWCEALSAGGRRSVVLKGVSLTPEALGAVCFDHKTSQTDFVSAPRIPGQFHGTGDLFASVLTGALVQNRSLPEAAQLAASFTSDCAKHQGTPCREGLDFEPLLWRLGRRVEEEYHA
ncbi:MAG: pyridoxamine kinase [Oscillibacter sp.]|nr:pyridoxamine kinase [Oscillibacter sp.]